MGQKVQIVLTENDDETFKVKIGCNAFVSDSGDCDDIHEALGKAVEDHDEAKYLYEFLGWE